MSLPSATPESNRVQQANLGLGMPQYHSTPRRLDYQDEATEPMSPPPIPDTSALFNNSQAVETAHGLMEHNADLMRRNQASAEEVARLKGNIAVLEAREESVAEAMKEGAEWMEAQGGGQEFGHFEAEMARVGVALDEESQGRRRLQAQHDQLLAERDKYRREADELRRALVLRSSKETEAVELRERVQELKENLEATVRLADASRAEAERANLNLLGKTEEVTQLRSELDLRMGSSIQTLRQQMKEKDQALSAKSAEVESLKRQLTSSGSEKKALKEAENEAGSLRVRLGEMETLLLREREESQAWKRNAEAQFAATTAEFEERLAIATAAATAPSPPPHFDLSALNTSLWDLIPQPIRDGLSSLKGDAAELHRIVNTLKGLRLDASSILEASGHAQQHLHDHDTTSTPAVTFKVLEDRLSEFTGVLEAMGTESGSPLVERVKEALRAFLSPSTEEFHAGLANWSRRGQEWQQCNKEASPNQGATAALAPLRQNIRALEAQVSSQEADISVLRTRLEGSEDRYSAARERVKELEEALDSAREEAKNWRTSEDRARSYSSAMQSQAAATVEQMGAQLREAQASEANLRTRLAQLSRDVEELRRQLSSERSRAETFKAEASLPRSDPRLKLELQLAKASNKSLCFQLDYLKRYELPKILLWERNNLGPARPIHPATKAPRLRIVAFSIIWAIRLVNLRRRHAKAILSAQSTPRHRTLPAKRPPLSMINSQNIHQ